MDQRQAMNTPARMSVPQFGGWDQKAPGATDYSMVFAQARTNKKNQKSDLTEVKHTSPVNELATTEANHGHHPRPASAPAHGHHARPALGQARPQVHADANSPEDPIVVMNTPAKMSVPQFGAWDQKAPGASDYSMVFAQARTNKKNQKSDLTEVKHTSLVNEPDTNKANHGHHPRPASAPAHGHHAHPALGQARPQVHADAHSLEDPIVVMNTPAKMSVPQFGAWDQKAPGAINYSMVFAQARTNKKNQKSDLTEVKRTSLVNEPDAAKANHGHHPRPASAPAHGHHAHPPLGQVRPQVHANAHSPEDPIVVMGKRRILTYINCCIRP